MRPDPRSRAGQRAARTPALNSKLTVRALSGHLSYTVASSTVNRFSMALWYGLWYVLSSQKRLFPPGQYEQRVAAELASLRQTSSFQVRRGPCHHFSCFCRASRFIIFHSYFSAALLVSKGARPAGA
jgi:hypothetical protein